MEANSQLDVELSRAFANEQEKLQEIYDDAQLLLKRTHKDHFDLLVVLGSGLLEAADLIGEIEETLPFFDIPGVKDPAVEGHGHNIFSVNYEGKNILVYTGRSHLYEDLDPYTLCLPVRVAAATGIKAAFLTNAGGCLRDWNLGELMAISDHMNFSGASPFNGPVFTDISGVWDKELLETISPLADRQGVYAMFRGPEYQTVAESKFLQMIGVDNVGMSTILEAMALHQLGVKVSGVSVVSDLSFAEEIASQETVIKAVQSSIPKIVEIVQAIAREL
ncbi:MAG: purine-nucleoside phosphorylase [Coriobacteriia bacterium]|nr:purine-nucleoside phosphorylase [Coriobacteriia bacterium]